MQIVSPSRALKLPGVWDELAGPFKNAAVADAWLTNPPEKLGDPGKVTVERKQEGWFVLSYRAPVVTEPLLPDAA